MLWEQPIGSGKARWEITWKKESADRSRKMGRGVIHGVRVDTAARRLGGPL